MEIEDWGMVTQWLIDTDVNYDVLVPVTTEYTVNKGR